ncbi:flagellar motor switch phosphatase FliY [Desulfitobacterium sp.]|uniref:flagellar motor switch phosphatase FliY n=1 Tax=Desulfitobacterium sp. TaxID=49981 RepID=UPI002B217B66|nr:flagellar motor switch phosphatase FliY [Desulfitobacterium sp.]MEA4900844.1 flagellar motor switch phosphatase FliY [Desulfitobacterium sp.]
MGNGMLSQEEIDALLRGTVAPETPAEEPVVEFSDMEKDAIGEIANISMGTAATTLSQLLGKKVDITTPKVDVTNAEQIRKDYPIPSVIVDVKYKAGIEGSNFLILSQRDGAVIVDLMMGGDGKNVSLELTDLQISGIGEAMNQMMGSAATSMSTMFNSLVDITPPKLVLNDMAGGNQEFVQPDEALIRISFRMVVEDVIDSILIQVIPVSVAKGMVSKLMGTMDSPAPQKPVPAKAQPSPQPQPVQQQVQAQPRPQPAQPRAQGSMPVQPAQFTPLKPTNLTVSQDNLGLILDVPLQVSVELGKAKKTIKEILELGPGSVIELDRLAGEPVDMIVNGKLVAKCEVVVINETFGIRVTDIIQPNERIASIQ